MQETEFLEQNRKFAIRRMDIPCVFLVRDTEKHNEMTVEFFLRL